MFYVIEWSIPRRSVSWYNWHVSCTIS